MRTISEPLRIHIAVESGNPDQKTYRDKNFSGTYSFHSQVNNRPVFMVSFNVQNLRLDHHLFQRDEKTEIGSQLYIWQHEDLKSWRLGLEEYFIDQSHFCHMYKRSTGKKQPT